MADAREEILENAPFDEIRLGQSADVTVDALPGRTQMAPEAWNIVRKILSEEAFAAA